MGAIHNTSSPEFKLELDSGMNAFPNAQCDREAPSSQSHLWKRALDDVRIATLQEIASGEGGSTDGATVGITGESHLNAVTHFRDMIFGQLYKGSHVSLCSLNLESLKCLLISHGINCCSLVEDMEVYHSAFLSHLLMGECFNR